ncbi:hypothetical protein [Anaplasma phagocytophilum]|uniref:Uncharacterized protein n=1 Tax=Anaplasma phagocytophilum str. NCH-1 TaxID=1359161 RepID=A0A0F3NDQ7_ANAPH|nr:hypothetical protein [Anaplasma phagocytophilum]KJV66193.1 hypothetical protein EPHNCH_0746 [Anaplasma phagocytophilum str. NCH-1]KJV66203.1 hypothetical protein EPHNCH_0729 [Anaplasma phagocytophilum str. NCH-1]
MRGMSHVLLGLYLGNNPDTRKSGNSHRNCIFARESYSYYCESGDTFS